MDSKECVQTLIGSGDIPEDAEIVSTNNKVVIISQSENLVARIGTVADSNLRDDPHDLRYSHMVSWLAGASAPAVRPLHPEPQVRGSYIISSYPLLNNGVELNASNANEIYGMVREFGDALPAVTGGIALRRLDVSSYVRERLDHIAGNSDFDQRLADYVRQETDRMDILYPFWQLAEDDLALVHGDLKADNVVSDDEGDLKAIDLDAAAAGPRLYDVASWRLRGELGDDAPVELVAESGRRSEGWNEDAFRALIGWKAISSMSFTLRYEVPAVNAEKVTHIAAGAVRLGGLATALVG